MSEGEEKRLMADSAWLEGVAGDLDGEPLPAALIEWKNDLPEALREVCNRIATADGGVWLVEVRYAKRCSESLGKTSISPPV